MKLEQDNYFSAVDSLKEILPDLCSMIFKGRDPTIDTFLFLVCSVIEKLTVINKNYLSSSEKLNIVFDLGPYLADILYDMGMITNDTSNSLKGKFTSTEEIVRKVELFIQISNNPNILNDKFFKIKFNFKCC